MFYTLWGRSIRFNREELFSSLAHDRPLLPPGNVYSISARAEAEVSNMKKDRLEVLRYRRNPSRNLVPECEPRGRG